ncbi:Phage transposase [Methylophaga frappieri]|uniref:Phage transposase n=1 Tax=Methylophaga frappieri (strain ATCC BAA-2434 / DSM 25690 / JAM7) TaxID=754477 RepID=I1YGE1_METFJ|nr:DDE-type integrase/transposase/recombinase [Methylophaga frappieri]AFJ01984.1 Phage transposase [Methylophaga frappieri]
MTGNTLQYLMDVANRAEKAGHGGKTKVYQSAADNMGISTQTLMRKLSEFRPSHRRRRKDAAQSALTRADAQVISAYMLDSRRKNGKRLASLEDAIEVLRSNGEIDASRIDEETGEVMPLSISAISRAMYQYNLHPEQLALPSPKVTLRSEHPNHVWQIDPSLCVLYYLPAAQGECLQVMDENKFYKNKPANIRRIEKERVWRYVITDHASGVIFVHYVLGAESGVNLLESFIEASRKRGDEPFYGIPKLVMVDPGSANTGAVFRNLCRALGITLQVNLPGQPWAKGQVEKANDIVERSFEHRLKFQESPPTSVDELNVLASQWRRWFNSTATHRRLKKPRFAAWMKIKTEQLRLAPDEKIMRSIAMNKAERRKVTVQLEVSFNGSQYSVASIPGVHVGMHLEVTRNPWHDDQAGVLYRDDDGREVMQIVQAIKRDEFGFDIDSPIIGETFRSHADTELDTNRKAVERLSMESDTDTEADKKRKSGATPLGGRIDAMKPINDTRIPEYLPRLGELLDVKTPKVESLRLNHVEAAKRLKNRIGDEWNPDHYQWLVQHYPSGIPEDLLDDVEAALTRVKPAKLHVIGGSN